MKEDVKIEKWSSMRGLERTGLMTLRLSPAERCEIENIAAKHRARPSDVIRASLIYIGVIPPPKPKNTKKETQHD